MICLLGIVFFLQITSASVWTPFTKKASCDQDFCYESKFRMNGEIVAFADYDDDRIMEIIMVDANKTTLKICEYDEDSQKVTNSKTIYTFQNTIKNVVPGDILFRGQTDLLVQTQKEGEKFLTTYLCYHSGETIHCNDIEYKMFAEANVFDVNGDNYVDIISQDENGETIVLLNKGDKTFNQTNEFEFGKYDKQFPVTFADMNGDCRSDIIFVSKNSDNTHSIQIYITEFKEKVGEYQVLKYTLHRTIEPKVQLTNILVSDFDRNGNMDIIISTTDEIIVLINEQKVLCKSFVKAYDYCRAETNMCQADNEFMFNLTNSKHYKFNETTKLHIVDGLSYIDIGDYNIDAYPDIMVLVDETNTTSRKTTRYMQLLKNVGGDHFEQEQSEKDKLMTYSTNALSGAFFDMLNNGMLNLFFNIKNEATNEIYVECISNNLKPDALFVKIDGLNGVCVSNCDSGYQKISPKPYGSMYFGGIFKLALTDTNGHNVGMISVQMSQTTHNSLQLPYAHIGLGRISNYIQVCEFGSNMNVTSNHQQFLSIIPNSQLVVIPHPPLKSSSWTIELYFLDLNLMFWIALVMTIALIILGIVMAILFVKDKKAEQKSNLLNMK